MLINKASCQHCVTQIVCHDKKSKSELQNLIIGIIGDNNHPGCAVLSYNLICFAVVSLTNVHVCIKGVLSSPILDSSDTMRTPHHVP